MMRATLATIEESIPSMWCSLTRIWESLPEMGATLTSPWLALTISCPPLLLFALLRCDR
jgi:hypothetical protein